MIPASLSAAYTLWTSSIRAASPLRKSAPLVKATLVTAGSEVVADTDAALAGAAGGLDASDPAGFPGAFENALLGLCIAATDQGDLAALRGIAGRQLFNLRQI